jgi:hypothetical protein
MYILCIAQADSCLRGTLSFTTFARQSGLRARISQQHEQAYTFRKSFSRSLPGRATPIQVSSRLEKATTHLQDPHLPPSLTQFRYTLSQSTRISKLSHIYKIVLFTERQKVREQRVEVSFD